MIKNSPVINVNSYKPQFSGELMAAPSEDLLQCSVITSFPSVQRTHHIVLKALCGLTLISSVKVIIKKNQVKPAHPVYYGPICMLSSPLHA